MTPDELKSIKTRMQNAAAWSLVETCLSADGLWLKPEFGTVEQGVKLEDQTPFFDNAQKDVAALVAEVERAWSEVERLRDENGRYESVNQELLGELEKRAGAVVLRGGLEPFVFYPLTPKKPKKIMGEIIDD